MTAAPKTPEPSINDEIIKKVHFALADAKTGEEILNFLRVTEPVFMEEVDRFIRTEMQRLKYQISDVQAIYMGSVIGASYIAGFLIAREASHQMFNGFIETKSDIDKALSPAEIDKIMDKELKQGKTYKEIAEVVKRMLEKGIKDDPSKKKEPKDKPNPGKHLELGDLD